MNTGATPFEGHVVGPKTASHSPRCAGVFSGGQGWLDHTGGVSGPVCNMQVHHAIKAPQDLRVWPSHCHRGAMPMRTEVRHRAQGTPRSEPPELKRPWLHRHMGPETGYVPCNTPTLQTLRGSSNSCRPRHSTQGQSGFVRRSEQLAIPVHSLSFQRQATR